MKREPRCKSALAQVEQRHVSAAKKLAVFYAGLAEENTGSEREKYLKLAEAYEWDAWRYRREIDGR